MSRPAPKALIFDYGNTLIAFGPDQQQAQLEAMVQVLEEANLPVNLPELNVLRKEQVVRPFHSDGVENKWEEVCREVIALHQSPPDPALVKAIMQARYEAFLSSVQVKPEVLTLLQSLKDTYRLGLLSNYPDTPSIVDSLTSLGLADFFEHIVVSADVGFAKPHPAPFREILSRMAVQGEDAVYIGDNWLADIQGGGRQGMRTVWIREHLPYEVFEPQQGDLPASAEIETLQQLPEVLASWA